MKFSKRAKEIIKYNKETNQKTAIVTGVQGQDGSHLTDLLLEKNYLVIGVARRKSTEGNRRIFHLLKHKNFKLISGDITDQGFLNKIVSEHKPDEFYNIAAMSFVAESWNTPVQTFEIDALGPLKCLEAIRQFSPNTKFLQASSSEQFGKVQETPQTEKTPFYPRSPYGVSKVAAYWAVVNYRESYNVFAVNSICFNHEGPRRGSEFVTKKITENAVRIHKDILSKKKISPLELGNLDSKRDWGYAGDYVEAMWRMLQQEKPDDYVIATGETHTVAEFAYHAFKTLGYELVFFGSGKDTVGKVLVGRNWIEVLKVSPKFFRPAEVDLLIGDATKAKEKLKWEPKTKFKQLVKMMVESEL